LEQGQAARQKELELLKTETERYQEQIKTEQEGELENAKLIQSEQAKQIVVQKKPGLFKKFRDW
jgi:hypothetical protein